MGAWSTRSAGVVVVGSVNTDLVVRVARFPRPGETLTAESFATSGGGKGANQAIAAARLGARVAMVGAVGRDGFSDERLADLAAAGVDIRRIARSAELPGGVAVIQVDASGENAITIVPGANGAVDAQQVSEAVLSTVTAGDIVACQCEIPLVASRAALMAARTLGARTLLNAAPALLGARELLPLVDVLVINEIEAGQLAGLDLVDPESVADAAERLAAMGPEVVVVTLGAQGAFLREGAWTRLIRAIPTEVVDSTGAGDAFVGALLSWLAEGRPAAEAVVAGVAAGSLAVRLPGAQPSLPTRAALDDLLSRRER